MEALPLRMLPDVDLRGATDSGVAARQCRVALVISMDNLKHARLKLAGRAETDPLNGHLAILTLTATVSSAPIAKHRLHLEIFLEPEYSTLPAVA